MNAFSPDDFGDTSDLLRALGLVKEDGKFNEDWLSNPEDYLRDILANDLQRDALLAFVQSMRDGESERDAEGRHWIELFGEDVSAGARVRFYLVLDDDPVPATQVHLFLGVKFETKAPLTESQSSLMIPLFRAGKDGGGPRPSPELINQQGGFFAVFLGNHHREYANATRRGWVASRRAAPVDSDKYRRWTACRCFDAGRFAASR